MKYSFFIFMLLFSWKVWGVEVRLTPSFFGQVKIEFDYSSNAKGGNDLVGILVSGEGEKTPLPTNCPPEGGDAKLGDVYTLNFPDDLLVVTCLYNLNHSGLGIKGVDYRSMVFNGKGGLHQRKDIGYLISGYEGTVEDGGRSYFFYDNKELAALKIKSVAKGDVEDPLVLAHKVVIRRLHKQDDAALAYYVSPQRVAKLLAQNPLSKENAGLYNDMGYALSEIGNYHDALKLLYAVEKVVPNRMVLMLNIADSLWASGSKSRAKEYYSKYRNLMSSSNKEALIPLRVDERLGD